MTPPRRILARTAPRVGGLCLLATLLVFGVACGQPPAAADEQEGQAQGPASEATAETGETAVSGLS